MPATLAYQAAGITMGTDTANSVIQTDHMLKSAAFALSALLLAAALPARADCHWAWHCDQSGACGFVPFCDSPNDKPPPLQGMPPPNEGKSLPVPPNPHSQRKPLPGFKPINPPPPATRQITPPEPCEPDKNGPLKPRT
jgi:hypothetical protein